MHIIIIAGFLGSGKTTVLLSLAKYFHSNKKGLKLAVIENEVGNIGIDGQTIESEGLEVREIYSGCICCSLRMNLSATLLELEKQFDPDIVFLEPSGVASPDAVKDVFLGYGGEISGISMMLLLDASRFQIIKALKLPFATRGLHTADFAVINKIDAADPGMRDMIESEVLKIRSDIPVFSISAKTGLNFANLAEKITKVCEKGRSRMRQDAMVKPKKTEIGPDASVFSCSFDLKYLHPMSPEAISSALSETLVKLSSAIMEGGCSLIGHIKGIIRNRAGYLLFSITEAGKEPSRSGAMRKKSGSFKITVNVIIYGIGKERLHEISEKHICEFRKAVS